MKSQWISHTFMSLSDVYAPSFCPCHYCYCLLCFLLTSPLILVASRLFYTPPTVFLFNGPQRKLLIIFTLCSLFMGGGRKPSFILRAQELLFVCDMNTVSYVSMFKCLYVAETGFNFGTFDWKKFMGIMYELCMLKLSVISFTLDLFLHIFCPASLSILPSAPDTFYFHNATLSTCFRKIFPKVRRWRSVFLYKSGGLDPVLTANTPIFLWDPPWEPCRQDQ